MNKSIVTMRCEDYSNDFTDREPELFNITELTKQTDTDINYNCLDHLFDTFFSFLRCDYSDKTILKNMKEWIDYKIDELEIKLDDDYDNMESEE